MPARIYTITTLERLETDDLGLLDHGDTRCVGWFSDIDEARHAVTCNLGDMNEAGSYKFALIECMSEGLYPSGLERELYQFDTTHNTYVRTEEPECMAHVCAFALG